MTALATATSLRPVRPGKATPPVASAWVKRRTRLRAGFVRLADAAPLVAAHELGLFKKRGLEVGLSREIGWAAIRHRATFDGLDVVHAPGPLALAMTLGIGGPTCPCVAGMVLNLHGNAITLSKRLREDGVRDGPSLANHIFSAQRREPLTLAIVTRYSSHYHLLSKWLRGHAIDLKKDARLVVLPPDQMVRNLAAGHIDGFCAGEPWNSLAVAQAGGWCPAVSAELDSGHAEKVLMTTEDLVSRRGEEYTALVAAVLEACAWCDTAAGRAELPEMLARREYLDLPAKILAASLQGPFDRGDGRREPEPNFIIFHRFEANKPTEEKALWMLECLAQAEPLAGSEKHLRQTAFTVFRGDWHRAGERLAENNKKL